MYDLTKLNKKIKELNTTQLISLSEQCFSTTFDEKSDVRKIIEECLPEERFTYALVMLQLLLLRDITQKLKNIKNEQ